MREIAGVYLDLKELTAVEDNVNEEPSACTCKKVAAMSSEKFSGKKGIVVEESDVVTIGRYHDVPQNSEESFLTALANQPLSVAIEASGRDFQFNSGFTTGTVEVSWITEWQPLDTGRQRGWTTSLLRTLGDRNGERKLTSG
ncbi:hypothetical protein RJ639_022111 [Escallonia herrerae]|uniref:Peptidase C1A papain C-terminal domain-containing protein n=1 Tax=Escallonia herrerae TaxID=1293975 RepID=A0AA88V5F8_9ASTE|nr:hypothetical protein RJ639_022111 [Escallonia herrerae]